jgi:hypothetical protein
MPRRRRARDAMRAREWRGGRRTHHLDEMCCKRAALRCGKRDHRRGFSSSRTVCVFPSTIFRAVLHLCTTRKTYTNPQTKPIRKFAAKGPDEDATATNANAAFTRLRRNLRTRLLVALVRSSSTSKLAARGSRRAPSRRAERRAIEPNRTEPNRRAARSNRTGTCRDRTNRPRWSRTRRRPSR